MYESIEDKIEYITLCLKKYHIHYIPLENDEQIHLVFDMLYKKYDGSVFRLPEEEFKKSKTGALEIYVAFDLTANGDQAIFANQINRREAITGAYEKNHPLALFIIPAVYAWTRNAKYVKDMISEKELGWLKKRVKKEGKTIFGKNYRLYDYFTFLLEKKNQREDPDLCFKYAESLYLPTCMLCATYDLKRTLRILKKKEEEKCFGASYVLAKMIRCFNLLRGIYCAEHLRSSFERNQNIMILFFLAEQVSFPGKDFAIRLLYKYRHCMNRVEIHEFLRHVIPQLSLKSIPKLQRIFEDKDFFDLSFVNEGDRKLLLQTYRQISKMRRVSEIQNMHIAILSQGNKFPKVYEEIYKEIYQRT